MSRAAPPGGGDDSFKRLLRDEASSVEQKLASDRAEAQAHSQQLNLAVLSQHATLPVVLSSVEVHGTNQTRRSFLDPIFQPLVRSRSSSSSSDGTTSSISPSNTQTLADMLAQISVVVGKLQRFDIFHPDEIHVHLNQPSQPHNHNDSLTPPEFDVSIRVREKSRLLLKTGTDLGNAEGSAYGNLLWRNIFGGAESLSLNASAGTRTRSAYTADLSTPLYSNPDLRLSLEGLMSNVVKPWASHEELLKGGSTKLSWMSSRGDRHQFGYSGIWRQVTGLAERASPSVRGDAGDSFKSALNYSFSRDRRDNPMLPQSGYLFKAIQELAGWGSLGGDVAFSKTEVEAAGALPIPIPGVRGSSGVSIGAAFRAGMLYPLPTNYGMSGAKPSRINDRFTLGGPTDVRGFTLGGLGPRDGHDALGGDVFAAGSVNLLLPLPRVGADSPFRIQLFANGGRCVALQSKIKGQGQDEKGSGGGSITGGMDSGVVWHGMTKAVKAVTTGLPSLAAGIGLVYAHPVARFEVNFSLPLVMRRGEESRKGVSVGVGINLL